MEAILDTVVIRKSKRSHSRNRSRISDLIVLACLGLQDEGVEFLAKKEGSSTRAASKSLDLYYETHF
ncbi:hypothetical protein CTI12_AA587960 [Artemisia annua]|uniref:Uncharacterized protein n=1 Tax=Artemisia annua TaxID=35608 RepID=A0A2U1KLN3_ARTAN|nr:hypothetical protein CTI12_AA587960 [Artemisia annua]